MVQLTCNKFWGRTPLTYSWNVTTTTTTTTYTGTVQEITQRKNSCGYFRMAEMEVVDTAKKKHIMQPPSVPFLWEERPGIAKKDWRPSWDSSVPTVLPLPVKLIASVPFNWEEKPGKPLCCFSQPPDSALVTSPTTILALPSPLMCSQADDNHEHKSGGSGGEGSFSDELEGMFNSELGSFNFETDDSFSSAPSLLANCLVSSVAISAAVPVLKTSSTDDRNGQVETPSSPTSDSDGSTSSYATGISSLEGAAFLERLFPLYPPKSGFLGKDSHCEKECSTPEGNSRDFQYEHNTRATSVIVRRPPTLGELIMMSRRRSCQRKAVQMRKNNQSKEFINKKAFGCCIFGTSIHMIEELQRKIRQPRLKLI